MFKRVFNRLIRVFNRLIAKTSIYRGLMASWENEAVRAENYRGFLENAENEIDNFELNLSAEKRKNQVIRREMEVLDTHLDSCAEALDVVIADKYRAIGANAPLVNEIAYLRGVLANNEQAAKFTETFAHLEVMLRLAGQHSWGDGDAERYVKAEDFVRHTKNKARIAPAE